MEKSINVILNTDNRLDILIPLFRWFNNKNLGRYSNKCFTMESSVSVQPGNQQEKLFEFIQAKSRSLGHSFVCYNVEL